MALPNIVRCGNVITAFFGRINVIQWVEVNLQYEVKPCDVLLVVPVYGDALTGDGITEGDMVVARMNFTIEELTPGKLVLVTTPHGLLVLHVYLNFEGGARFAPSNKDCESYLFRGGTFNILGIVVEVIEYNADE